jgi:DNA-binding Xre family transcriptional regulator
MFRLLKNRGITLEQFSDTTGISKRTFTRLHEISKPNKSRDRLTFPTIRIVEIICHHLRCEISDIMVVNHHSTHEK